tara:strand:+ start:168 stop:431 length:264 start_codon:yes stop_codon:yes gene_type:complete
VNKMKRMKMRDIKTELDREIRAVVLLKGSAFFNQDLDDFFRLCERLDALFYTYHLIHGNSISLGCYQTGMHKNSNGAKYTPSEKESE